MIITDQVTIQNQDPTLNETASLLAQSLRETEDELTRNMLEATASFINCVNGVNGKHVAVLKSLLMDLELSARNGGDDREQAAERWAA